MFYKKFLVLCSERGISPSKVASDIRIAKSRVTGWKNGSMPQNATMLKLADYFGVNIDYFTNEDTRCNSFDAVNEAEMKVALFGGDVEVTDAMWEEARAYAQVIAARERGRRNDK